MDAGEPPPLNSPQYWNERFLTDWAARGGQKQTTFFAHLAKEMLPSWFVTAVRDARMSIYDYGCAFGDALPVLRSAFPNAVIKGGDVAPVALAVARCVHPEYGFELLSAEGDGDFLADVVYCSNTLEHFADWHIRLEKIARRTHEFCVVLVPFRESEPREPEHAVAFDYGTVPLRLKNDFQLLHLATVDASARTPSFWSGEQLLAIYGKPTHARTVEAEAAHSMAFDVSQRSWSIDLRGVPDTLSKLILDLRHESLNRASSTDKELHAALERVAAQDRELAAQAGELVIQKGELEARQSELLAQARELKAGEERVAELEQNLQRTTGVLKRAQQEIQERRQQTMAQQKAVTHLRELNEKQTGDLSELAADKQRLTQEINELTASAENREHELTRLNSEICQLHDDLSRLRDELAITNTQASESSGRLQDTVSHVQRFAAAAARPMDDLQARLKRLKINLASEIERRNTLIVRLQNARSIKIARALRGLLGRSKAGDGFPEFAPPNAVTFNPPDLGAVQSQIDRLTEDVLATIGRSPQEAGSRDALLVIPPAVAAPSLPSIRFPEHSLIFQLDRFDAGGLEQVVSDLAWGFRNRGFPVAVIVSNGVGRLGKELQARGIEVVTCEGDEAKHCGVIEKFKPRIVFLNHCYFGFDNWKTSGARIFDIVHNYYFWQDPQRMREAAAASEKTIVVSEAVASFHAQRFGVTRDKLVVISNPLNPADLNRPAQTQLRAIRSRSAELFTFISIANFYPAKAHIALLTAFAEVCRTHPHARLKLLGDFANAMVEQRVREILSMAALESSVQLKGHRSRREVGFELATAHAFVLPSIYEGCSIAMAEAAYYGLPLVLTNVGSACEMIENEDCGILIPAPIDLLKAAPSDIERLGLQGRHSNHQDLVAALSRMIEEYPVWQERGFAGQDKIARRTLDSRITTYSNVAGLPLA